MSLPLIFNFSLWVVMLFLLVDLAVSRSHPPVNRFWIQLISGLAVGICMSLLTRCLESEHLDAPWTRILTACFYFYAVLQLAYIGFNPPPPRGATGVSALEKYLEEFATITSLPLKLLLIGFCFWSLKEGRLAFYMEKTRTLIENVPGEWDEFRNTDSAADYQQAAFSPGCQLPAVLSYH